MTNGQPVRYRAAMASGEELLHRQTRILLERRLQSPRRQVVKAKKSWDESSHVLLPWKSWRRQRQQQVMPSWTNLTVMVYPGACQPKES